VMRFDVTRGGGAEEARVPRRLRPLEPLPPATASRRWDLALGATAWQINGLAFDPARIDVRPERGTTERWTFVNHSNRVHPMHLHGFLFRILERSSGRVHPADRLGWKDTIGVLPNETATVLAWFSPYGGKYVFHCHALEHADKAMMLQMEVTA
jgi:spore coat protein A